MTAWLYQGSVVLEAGAVAGCANEVAVKRNAAKTSESVRRTSITLTPPLLKLAECGGSRTGGIIPHSGLRLPIATRPRGVRGGGFWWGGGPSRGARCRGRSSGTRRLLFPP